MKVPVDSCRRSLRRRKEEFRRKEGRKLEQTKGKREIETEERKEGSRNRK